MCDFNFEDYDQAQHRHRFAAWCASTAAFRNLKVSTGVNLIEESGLHELSGPAGWGALPDSTEKFDAWHREKRNQICTESRNHPAIQNNRNRYPNGELTHGFAAKLINVYMKVLFLGSVQQDQLSQENKERQNLIHPPVDRMLLEELKRELRRREGEGCPRADDQEVQCLMENPVRNWTRLDSGQYEEIIVAFRHIANGDGLWNMEKYWKGYR